MLYWSTVFFIGAIVAALFGFGVIASAVAFIARVLFFLFLGIFLVLLVIGLLAR